MNKEDYIKTIVVNDKEIKLGLDDYGQCYYIEYLNDKNEIETTSLETYNTYYMEEIYYMFDPRFEYLERKNSFFKLGIYPREGSELSIKYPNLGKEPLTREEEEEYNNYLKMFREEENT